MSRGRTPRRLGGTDRSGTFISTVGISDDLSRCHIFIEALMPRTARLFWSGRSQAVRLPKEFRMEGAEVRIRRQGAAVILEPLASNWAWLDAIVSDFSDDFFAAGRSQPEHSLRTDLDRVFD